MCNATTSKQQNPQLSIKLALAGPLQCDSIGTPCKQSGQLGSRTRSFQGLAVQASAFSQLRQPHQHPVMSVSIAWLIGIARCPALPCTGASAVRCDPTQLVVPHCYGNVYPANRRQNPGKAAGYREAVATTLMRMRKTLAPRTALVHHDHPEHTNIATSR